MRIYTKLFLIFLTFISFETIFAQNYSFYLPQNNLNIRDVEYQNGKVYLLGSQAIQVFDPSSNKFEVLFSNDDLFNQGLTKIKDMVFFEDDLYVINDNKLINISDGFKEYSFADEYDFKPRSDKYRELYNLTVRGNSLLIGSASSVVLSRDTLAGTPFVHLEQFDELFEYKSSFIKRVVDERKSNNNFNFLLPPVLDKHNNLWFVEYQDKPLQGGVIKISPNNEVEVFDLKSYSMINYQIRPSSIDFIDNLLYIGLVPRKETNYLEGISIYNTDSKVWEYSIDYLENNDIYEGLSWDTPSKIKKLNNGSIAILGKEFTIQNDNGYLYFELTKTQKEKFGVLAYYRNLDLYETESKYIIIRQNGILVFDKSTITNVEEKFITKYEYKINNNSVEFENVINNYKVYDLLGKVIKSGENGNTIDISNLIAGPFFILLNEEYIIKFIKE